MALSAAAALRRDGYILVRGLFTGREVSSVLREAEAVFSAALKARGARAPRGLDAKYLELKKLSPLLKSHAYDLLGHLGALRALPTQEKVLRLVRPLVGSVVLIDKLQIRVDDPSNDRNLPFHQEMFGQLSELCATVWSPLVDADGHSGALRIVPGSHRAGLLPHAFHGGLRYHGVAPGVVRDADVRVVEAEAGDAVVFHPLLVHASGPNHTSRVRWTVTCRFNSLSRVPYLTREDAPSHIPQTES